jgi:hypothetical protein
LWGLWRRESWAGASRVAASLGEREKIECRERTELSKQPVSFWAIACAVRRNQAYLLRKVARG